jgi:hypothetical protein
MNAHHMNKHAGIFLTSLASLASGYAFAQSAGIPEQQIQVCCADVPNSRDFTPCWQYMGAKFRVQKQEKHCSGRRVAVFWRGRELSRPPYYKWDAHRDATTDTAFLAGRGMPLNGTFTWHYRNGALRAEHVYQAGRLLSEKNYRKKGGLVDWFDYDFGYDTTYYTTFTQSCDKATDENYLREWIFTVIDGRMAAYDPAYAWRFRKRALGYPKR